MNQRIYWVFIFLLSMLAGCGGGFSGTDGGGGIRVVGVVNDEHGRPLSEVLVSDDRTHDQALTDANGHFEFIGAINESQLTLSVEKDQKRTELSVEVTQPVATDTVYLSIGLLE